MPVVIDTSACIGCGACTSACPENALSLVDNVSTITGKCTSVGACVDVCPVGALSLQK